MTVLVIERRSSFYLTLFRVCTYLICGRRRIFTATRTVGCHKYTSRYEECIVAFTDYLQKVMFKKPLSCYNQHKIIARK